MAELADEHEANNLLFGEDEADQDASGKAQGLSGGVLNTEKDYVGFAGEVNALLDKGKAPYNLVPFFKELANHNLKNMESKKIKQIVDHITKQFNDKVKEEREKDKPKQSKKKAIKGGKAYDKNNNAAMVNDMMGDDGYGDEDQDVEFKKAEEEQYDFM